MRQTVLCSLLLAGLPTIPLASAEIHIEGVVRDAAGAPVAGALVTLLPERSSYQTGVDDVDGRVAAEPEASASSDRGGSYLLRAPRSGLWRVRVSADGFVPMGYRLWPLVEETILPPAELRPAVPISVLVTAPDGEPVASATVTSRPTQRQFWVPRRSRRTPWWPASRRAVTGEDGTVSIPRAEGEEMEFSAYAPGFAAAGITKPEGGAVALRLTAGAPVVVNVTDAGGEPAAGAVVLVGEQGWAAGLTGEDGSFTAVVPEDRKVTAVAASGARAAAVAEPGDGPLRLRLVPPRTLSGRVVDAHDRSPVADALVWSGSGGDSVGRTDRAGGFALAIGEIDEARYLQAAAAGYFREWLQLAESAEFEPVLALEPAAAAVGRVVDTAGNPVAGATVVARVSPVSRAAMRRASRQQDQVLSDEAGRFRLGGLVPGTPLTLVASRDGLAPAELELPVLAPRESRRGLELVLGRGVDLSGRLLGDGAPAADAELELEREPQGSTPWAMMAVELAENPPLAGSSAGDGSFAYTNLAAGSYRLTVKAPGFAPLVARGIDVGESGTDLGTLTLEPGVEIHGVVVDGDGRPLAGAELRAASQQAGFTVWRDDDTVRPPAAVSADDGSFRLVDRQRGERVDLTAKLAGHAPGLATAVEAPNSDEVRITLERVATITGEVVAADGTPIAGAQVAAQVDESSVSAMRATYYSSDFTAHDQTDESGRFELDSVPPGKLRVTATAQGWRQAEHQVVELPAGGELEGLRLVLSRGATVTGLVLRADGQPAGNVMVRVEEGRPRMMSMPAMARVGGDGRYVLEGVEPGSRVIVAQDMEENRVSREIEVLPGVNRLDLRFGGGFEVSGRVTDETAAPIAGASVSLLSQAQAWRGREAQADVGGRFSFAGVPEGDYFIRASHPGHASHTAAEPLRILDASISGLEIRLGPGGSIRGQIRGLEPSELARVELMATTMQSAYAVGRVSHDGSYQISDLAAGDWQIQAMLGTRQVTARATLAPGELETVVDIEFGTGLTLSGQVLSAGEPMAGLAVVASGLDTAAYGGGQTDHQGRFRLDGLKPGRQQLMINDFRGGLRHVEEVELFSDLDIVVEVATGRIAGRVFDGGDLSPIRGAEVGLLAVGEEAAPFRFVPLGMGGSTDSQGQFAIPQAAAGEHRLRVVKDGYAPAERTLSLAPGAELLDLEILLEPTSGLRLVVLGPSGSPPAEIQYSVLDASGQALTLGNRPVDSAGLVRLPSVPTGRFELLVAASGAAVARLEAESPGPAVTVALQASGRLEVTVAELEGSNSLASVRLTGADGRPFLGIAWGSAMLQEWPLMAGRVVIEGLPAGRFDVLVTAPDGRQWQGSAPITAGQLNRLRL